MVKHSNPLLNQRAQSDLLFRRRLEFEPDEVVAEAAQPHGLSDAGRFKVNGKPTQSKTNF